VTCISLGPAHLLGPTLAGKQARQDTVLTQICPKFSWTFLLPLHQPRLLFQQRHQHRHLFQLRHLPLHPLLLRHPRQPQRLLRHQTQRRTQHQTQRRTQRLLRHQTQPQHQRQHQHRRVLLTVWSPTAQVTVLPHGLSAMVRRAATQRSATSQHTNGAPFALGMEPFPLLPVPTTPTAPAKKLPGFYSRRFAVYTYIY